MNEDQTVNWKECISQLEKTLKVHTGFFESLANEKNDWSVLVKLHALVEAAISHLLIEKLGNNKLRECITALELSNNRSGKIAFLKAVGHLDRHINFIKRFSELRNKYIHDISKIEVKITDFYAEHSDMEKEMINALKKIFPDAVIKANFRIYIYYAVAVILLDIYAHIQPRPSLLVEMLSKRLDK